MHPVSSENDLDISTTSLPLIKKNKPKKKVKIERALHKILVTFSASLNVNVHKVVF